MFKFFKKGNDNLNEEKRFKSVLSKDKEGNTIVAFYKLKRPFNEILIRKDEFTNRKILAFKTSAGLASNKIFTYAFEGSIKIDIGFMFDDNKIYLLLGTYLKDLEIKVGDTFQYLFQDGTVESLTVTEKSYQKRRGRYGIEIENKIEISEGTLNKFCSTMTKKWKFTVHKNGVEIFGGRNAFEKDYEIQVEVFELANCFRIALNNVN